MPGTQQHDEPEVLRAVRAEIDRMDGGYKELFGTLKTSMEQMKGLVDRMPSPTDICVRSELERWKEDIVTRQEALDKINAARKAVDDRVDALQVSLKRGPFGAVGGDGAAAKAFTEAQQFKAFTLSAGGVAGATTVAPALVPADQVNVGEYEAYRKVFDRVCRQGLPEGGRISLTPEEQRTLMVGSEPSGGYWVTPTIIAGSITRAYDEDPIVQICRNQPISTDTLEGTVDRDEVGSGWGTETTTIGAQRTPLIGKRRIPTWFLDTRSYITQQLLDDAAVNVEEWLGQKIGEKTGRDRGAAHVTGTGVNQPRGFLTYPNGTAWDQVERVNLGAALLPTTDGLIRLKFHLMERYLRRATWVVNRMTIMEAMLLKDGFGRMIWQDSLTADTPSILLGIPVRMSTTMPVVAAGSLSVCIADWQEFYMAVNRAGMRMIRDALTMKPLVEFWTRERFGGDVWNFEAGKIGVISA